MMIKVIIFKNNGEKFDITNLVTDINWSGDINNYHRQLEISLQNANNYSGDNLVEHNVGDLVLFYYNNEELFRGLIFKRSMSHTGKESLLAYDELIYTVKNSDTLLVKNKQASDVINLLFKKFGIAIGSIEKTNYKIKKLLFENQAINEIIKTCLEETRKNTGKLYHLYSIKGEAYLKSRQNSSKATISVDNIISGTNEISIEDTKTQVLITKGSFDSKENKFVSYVEKDSELAKKFGIMQHVESVDEKTNVAQMKVKAKALLNQLKQPNKTISIDFIGDPSCITGNIIEVYDKISNISGRYYITSDNHSFSNGVHKMTLQLSNKLE